MPSPTAASFRPSMRDTLQAVDDRAARCAYPSKPCANARAVKLNGDAHNFCEFHRRKANMNQRRWQQRRRRMRHIGDTTTASAATASPRDELESAEAVVMLQQSAGRYSPVPAYSWPRYSPTSVEWAPQHAPAPMLQAPYRPNVNVLASTLPRSMPFENTQSPIIPPLRSLPLPALLPSAFASTKTSPPPRPASASVYTC